METTEIYTLSLHDALPILRMAAKVLMTRRFVRAEELSADIKASDGVRVVQMRALASPDASARICTDRKSTRLNSSHVEISYAVFCLKKKKHNERCTRRFRL